MKDLLNVSSQIQQENYTNEENKSKFSKPKPKLFHKATDQVSSRSENTWSVILCCHAVFWSGVFYGLYKFYFLSQKLKKNLLLTETKSVFGNHQDQNDLEWKVFNPFIRDYALYGILHLVLAQIVRCYIPQVLKLLYIVLSTILLLKLIGVYGTGLCFLVPAVAFVVLFTRLKAFVWLTWCSMLVLFNCHFLQILLEKMLSDHEEGEYVTSVIVAWILLKSVSMCLVTCDEDPNKQESSLHLFINLLSYCLYLPNLVTGPFMPYRDYLEGVNKRFVPWNFTKVLWFIGQCGRFLCWMWIADTLLYHFYAHSMIYHPEYIYKVDQWMVAGYYSFLLIFFLLKYVVMYGLPSVLARAEGYKTPDPPRCVILIQRFSDIWRNFDIGLHRFMVDHIYRPFLGDDHSFFKQVQGSVVVFTFVYVWHGTYPSVFWWCVINFLFTIIEKLVDKMVKTRSYIQFEETFLPHFVGKLVRLGVNGLFLSLSAISLIIFLASIEHARATFFKIYVYGFPHAALITSFFFALMSQAAFDLSGFRRRRKLKES